MNDGNFKIRCIDVGGFDFLTKDKIYEFINGKTLWDKGFSSTYKNYDSFIKNSGFKKDMFELVEETDEYPLTIQDVFNGNYDETTKFECSDGHVYHLDKNSLLLYNDYNSDIYNYYTLKAILNFKFKIKQKEKKYIEPLEALKLIKNRQEVCCEYDNKFFKFNNTTTKKIRIDFILNGKWYVME